jgi:hypothetical protein
MCADPEGDIHHTRIGLAVRLADFPISVYPTLYLLVTARRAPTRFVPCVYRRASVGDRTYASLQRRPAPTRVGMANVPHVYGRARRPTPTD